jgi:hypothetical protein
MAFRFEKYVSWIPDLELWLIHNREKQLEERAARLNLSTIRCT